MGVAEMLLCLPRGGRVQQLGHSSSATSVLTVGRVSRRVRSTPRSVSHRAAHGAASGSWPNGGIRPFYSFCCEARMGSSLACGHRISVPVMITRSCWCKEDKQAGPPWQGPGSEASNFGENRDTQFWEKSPVTSAHFYTY